MKFSLTNTREIQKLAPTYSKTSEMPSLPPPKASNYYPPITKHTAKQKNQKCRYENKHLLSHFEPYKQSFHLTYTTSTAKNSPTNNPTTHPTHRKYHFLPSNNTPEVP